ncbi:AI-2E family transporter [bacterium]|nr:AI-2E family transporter [bacterium]
MSSTHLPNQIPRQAEKETYPHTAQQESFLRRTLIVVTVTAVALVLLWLLWQALDLVLLIFGGILLAVFLRALSNSLKRFTHLPDKVSLVVVLVLLLALIGGTIWLMGPRLTSQFSQLTQDVDSAAAEVRRALLPYSWGQQLLRWLPPMEQLIQEAQRGLTSGGIFSRVTGIASRTLEVLSNIAVVIFVGLFFAFDPGLYMRGLVQLFPHNRRRRIWEVLRAQEHMLRWWLLGTLISMVLAGVSSGIALWLLGVPLAVTLGLLMGIFQFVPLIGPLVATVPAVLIAFTVSPQTALWVIIVYEIIQIIEGNVILPIILEKAAEIPPAVTITAQVLLGVLAGTLGIIVATPLVASLLIIVQMLYVSDVLGDRMALEKTEN